MTFETEELCKFYYIYTVQMKILDGITVFLYFVTVHVIDKQRNMNNNFNFNVEIKP